MLDFQMKLTILLLIPFLFLSMQNVQADEWSSVESEHFIVMFSGSENPALNIQSIAEEFYPQVTSDLEYQPARKITIWFYESQKEYKQAASAPIQDWAAGYTYPLRAKIVIRDPVSVRNKRLNLEHLVKHEITHVVFGLYIGQNLANVPRWFNEGIAMYEAEDWNYANYWIMLTGTLSNSLIPLHELVKDFPQDESQVHKAYAQSCSIINFMVKRYGSDSIRECTGFLAEGLTIDDALINSIGISTAQLEREWLRDLKKKYRLISVITSWVVLWTFIVLLCLLAYWRRKVRNQRILRQWEEEEEMQWGFDEDREL